VIRLEDERYWLDASVDTGPNKLPYTRIETTTTKVFAHSCLTEISEKHEDSEAVFLVDGSYSLQDACHHHGFDFRYEKHRNRNAVERVYRKIKSLTIYFPNCFSNAETKTADDWLRSFSFAGNQLI
jgi:transposase-like protein